MRLQRAGLPVSDSYLIPGLLTSRRELHKFTGMWRIIFLIIHSGLWTSESAAVPVTDSLLTVMAQKPADSNTVNACYAYGLSLLPRETNKSAVVFRRGLSLSIALGYQKGVADFACHYMYIQDVKGNYSASLKLLGNAIRIYDSLGLYHNMARAVCYKGMEYQQLGDYPSAAAAYLQALKYSDQLNDTNLSGIIINRLSTVFTALGDHEKGFCYARMAYENGLQSGNSKHMALALINMGNSRNNGDFTIANRLYDQALTLSRQTNDSLLILSALTSRARVFPGRQAIEIYQQAMQHWPLPDTENQLILLLGYAKALYNNRQYQQANSHLDKALALAQQCHSADLLKQAYQLASENQAAQQHYKAALVLRHLYEQLNDSLTGINSRKTVQQLELQYQFEKKDRDLTAKQLLLAKKDLQLQQKNTWISIILSGLLLTIAASYFSWHQFRLKNYRQRQHLQMLETQQTLEVLEAVIKGEEKERKRLSGELHDGVGGTLSAIQMHFSAFRNERPWLHENESYNHALKMLQDAILDVRETAHNLAPDQLSRLGLVKALELFCKNASYSRQLRISFYTNGEIHQLKKTLQLSVYRMVQELVNNIIRHSHATEALVQVTQHQQLLVVTVEDNGVGFETSLSMSGGIGLKNLEERIRALDGQLAINTIPGSGTTVYIEFTIPVVQPVHAIPVI